MVLDLDKEEEKDDGDNGFNMDAMLEALPEVEGDFNFSVVALAFP